MASKLLNISFVILTTLLPRAVVGYQNVYGDTLQPCSSDGMALTGFSRTGYCIEQSDDTGSHHICINLQSTSGGNFCDVTGQNGWCSSDMPCVGGESASCPVTNWCVCQWAFASYIQNAGGCDQIQEIQCDAINLEAVIAYQSTAGYSEALDCLVKRCGLDANMNSGALRSSIGHSRRTLGLMMLVISLVLAVVCYRYLWQESQKERKTLNEEFLPSSKRQRKEPGPESATP